jgi:hypothetical protein
MVEHDVAQATTSRSRNKAFWLAALDALEQEYFVFQQRSGGAGAAAHANVAGARNAPDQLALDLRDGS